MRPSAIIRGLLQDFESLTAAHSATVGLDGYIDRIQHAVLTQGTQGKGYFPTLATFGAHVQQAAGKSAQVELDTTVIKPGGNAPIMSHALGSLGIKNTCLGNLGDEAPIDVFRGMHGNCQLLTVGAPAQSNALEFNDGKLILSDLSAFSSVDWSYVKGKIGLDRLRDNIGTSQLLALVGWCNPPYATEIWRGILKEIIEPMSASRPKLFFDLADPSKKSDDQIIEVVALINEYSSVTEVTLGLNENETIKLYQSFCRKKGHPASLVALRDVTNYVFNEMDINRLVVHPLDRCLATEGSRVIEVEGRLVQNPKVTTGGGDNFNAGFCFGLMNNRSLEECMVLAMATSGAYVQMGNSPDTDQLSDFLTDMIEA